MNYTKEGLSQREKNKGDFFDVENLSAKEILTFPMKKNIFQLIERRLIKYEKAIAVFSPSLKLFAACPSLLMI